MSDVRPLGFLLGRSLLNGVRRAITSPKRLIALVVFGFYYFQLFIGGFGSPRTPAKFPTGIARMSFPAASVVDAVVFGLLGLTSLLLMSSVLSYRGGFKAADVDVLFPTPVSPKIVLFFRITRDTLATLLFPIVIGLVGFKGISASLAPLFRDYPKQGGDILRSFVIAYLIVALVWVCIGYAASLFVNRSDFASDRNRKIIHGAVAAIVVGLALYIAFRLRMNMSWATLLDIAHNPVIRIVLAPVTLATWAVMGSFQGNSTLALTGIVGLLGLVAVALRIALTQVGWMYDQAAVRGFDSGSNMKELQRQGDILGIQAERARQGKLKHGRLARRIANLRVRGAAAMLWKEAILQARGSMSGLMVLGTIFLLATALVMWTTTNPGSSRNSGPPPAGWLLLGMQSMVVYVLCMANSQGGFIEFLRRVDVQKPLPFTPAATVFWEVVAKAVAPTVIACLAAVVGIAIVPAAWPHALAGILLSPALALMLSAVVLLVIVLFPDIEDPTQRMFRGLMLMLGIAVCLLVGTVAPFGVGFFFKLTSPLIVAPVVVAINLLIALGLSSVAGNLYASYNPSE